MEPATALESVKAISINLTVFFMTILLALKNFSL